MRKRRYAVTGHGEENEPDVPSVMLTLNWHQRHNEAEAYQVVEDREKNDEH
jgi:hypothetical protein